MWPSYLWAGFGKSYNDWCSLSQIESFPEVTETIQFQWKSQILLFLYDQPAFI